MTKKQIKTRITEIMKKLKLVKYGDRVHIVSQDAEKEILNLILEYDKKNQFNYTFED